ncbi:MAG: putative transporter, permease component [Ramlibacter sp.]|jgi:putative ABC transport system permease protein|nr:putative transporter, permease component [Ramlibacter sp.]
MKLLALAFRYLWSRPLATVLNLVLLTLGLASITFVVLVSAQVQGALQRDLRGIDLVVGAKGSPLQLILAGVFHIDVAPGNIKLADLRALEGRPQVAQVIPLSLGDSFRGFRIVGTTPAYAAHYGVTVAQGRAWTAPMEAVAGAGVARALGLKPGDRFVGGHGLGGSGMAHDAAPYAVTGVLSACGCVLDRLILTSTESVWHVHEPPAAPGQPHAEAHDDEDEDREVTLALVRYASPLAAASLPRHVNTQTPMQAAAPAVEVTRLLRLLGVGSEVLQGVAAVLLLTAALSVFIALWSAVRERRADLAMLRMLGASPAKVAGLLLAEALWLALIASALGLALGHALTAVAGAVLQAQQSLPVSGTVWLPQEGWIVAAALATAGVAALIPAIAAYRVDVAQLLQRA